MKERLYNFSALLVISLLTLNSQDHDFYAGLDGSYFWAFNYLLHEKPADLDKITFIYGPLAFLRNAICYGNLILWVCFFQTALKFFYGWFLLKIAAFYDFSSRLALTVFGLSCLAWFTAEVYIELLVILCLVFFRIERKTFYLYAVALLTALGYYIKCSIGLACILFQGIFAIQYFIEYRKESISILIRLFLANATALILIGLALFRSLSPIFTSVGTYYHNVIAFNETSSFYNHPDSIFLLSLCGIALISVLFVNKNATFRFFWLLCLIMLYSAYTHGIVRMDNSHYMNFIHYFATITITSAFFFKNFSRLTIPLILVGLFSYYANLSNKWDYSDYSLVLHNGPKNTAEYIFHHEEHRQQSYDRSQNNVKHLKISEPLLGQLRKGSIDFFPWDLLYVEANNFKNWQPRPFLQSLNMSSYFDKKTGEHFSSSQAPQFLVWHSCTNDTDFLHSFDDSYFLTNEFHSCLSIISNYKVLSNNDKRLYLEKQAKALVNTVADTMSETEVNDNEWINIPASGKVVGCSVQYNFNLLRPLKKLFYRDDEFYIEYKTETGEIFKRRFWPNDAKDFIWLSPFIVNPWNASSYKTIRAIRFFNTNENLHSGKLKIQFKIVNIHGEGYSGLHNWFNPIK